MVVNVIAVTCFTILSKKFIIATLVLWMKLVKIKSIVGRARDVIGVKLAGNHSNCQVRSLTMPPHQIIQST